MLCFWFFWSWNIPCSHNLTHPSSKHCFQTQTFRSFDKVTDEHSLVWKICPQSYFHPFPLIGTNMFPQAHLAPSTSSMSRLTLPGGKWHKLMNLRWSQTAETVFSWAEFSSWYVGNLAPCVSSRPYVSRVALPCHPHCNALPKWTSYS